MEPVDDYIFNEKGKFIRIDKNDKPDQIVVKNSKSGKVEGTYDFNDPKEDTKAIKSGEITKLEFISPQQIDQEMVDNGSATTK
ncbi:hypothetical protein GCM10027051_30600 [Niabella terrae]